MDNLTYLSYDPHHDFQWIPLEKQKYKMLLLTRLDGVSGKGLARKPHDDITRTSLDWNPQGSRKRGR